MEARPSALTDHFKFSDFLILRNIAYDEIEPIGNVFKISIYIFCLSGSKQHFVNATQAVTDRGRDPPCHPLLVNFISSPIVVFMHVLGLYATFVLPEGSIVWQIHAVGSVVFSIVPPWRTTAVSSALIFHNIDHSNVIRLCLQGPPRQ